MYKLSKSSLDKLDTCDSRLQEIVKEAIKLYDFTVLCGHRTESEQTEAFNKGNSKVQFPNSKHNSLPSKAVDLAPYPIDWNDNDRFSLLAGVIIGIAHMKGISIRWGADWDTDGETKDHSFRDYPHFELVE